MITRLLLLAAEEPAPKAPDAAEPSKGAIASGADTLSALAKRAKDWIIADGPGFAGRVFVALLLLAAAWIVAGWARRFVLTALHRAKIDATLAKFFGNITKWAIIIFAVVTCLGTLGINTTSVAAIVGAAGLAIGLALQGNLGNLASGVLLLVFRPFKIGDAVIVAGQSGIVDGIDLFTTNLDTPDNRRIIIPNGQIFGGVIENQSRHPTRRVVVSVTTTGGKDLEQTRATLLRAAAGVVSNTHGAMREPAPAVALDAIAPAIAWSVAVSAETAHYVGVREALLIALKRAVDEAQLSPAPPTSVVISRQG